MQPKQTKRRILIYQMGKVGSTALANAIEDPDHMHTLYGNIPCPHAYSAVEYAKIKFNYFKRRSRIKYENDKIKIITLVREPFSRSLSMFFQDLPCWLSRFIKTNKYETRKEGFEILEQAYYNTFNHQYYNDWFDNEIKRFTKIDILAEPFNLEKGWQIIERGRFRIFITRYESLGNVMDELSSFCEEKIDLQYINRSSMKWYSSVYDNFKKNFIPTKEFVNSMYNSKVVKHFYSESEVDTFKNKLLEKNMKI